MQHDRRRARLAALFLLGVLIWRMLGSPVIPSQWAALPSQAQMAWRQWPSRAQRMLRLWLGPAPQETVTVFDPRAQALSTLPLSEYLLGAVAAEMPASYHLEALKSQAVAIRTRLAQEGCPTCPQARVCLSAACCQGYLGPDARQERWGSDRAAYEHRIRQALDATHSLLLTYEGAPITVLYHAVSGGRTEDAAAVFSQALPYLVSVDSPGEEGASKFEARTVLSREEAAQQLNAAFPGAALEPEQLSAQISIREFSPAGRALTLQVGQETVSGRAFREALHLNSTWLTLQHTAKEMIILQKGYGHGVGMSQAGANAMAARGFAMEQILSHYYPGTSLSPV